MTVTEESQVPNRWIEGLYAPIDHETTSTELTVIGSIPTELRGRYLRNGPNPFGPIDAEHHHWFVGDGMVHGVRLNDGKAEWYRSRWIRSTKISDALGETPVPGERFAGMEAANTNVVGLGGSTFAIVEAGGRPAELSYDLETICYSDFGGTLPHGYTAHPKVDPISGDVHAVAYHWALPNLEYIVIGADGRVKDVFDIDANGSPMVHDCSITETWAVVYDFPCTFNLDVAMGGARLPYVWDPNRAARIGLVPLGSSGDPKWFEVDPCYSFHPLNAWDDGSTVVIDLVQYPKMFDVHRLGPDDAAPQLWRYRLDTATGTATAKQVSDIGMEFPRVDERLVGRRHRYGYGAEIRRVGDCNEFGGNLVLIDTQTDDVSVVDLGAGRVGGEWVMAPSSADAPENDGWIMTFVHDRGRGATDLEIRSAEDPRAAPVAIVQLPERIPLGFHGNWVPDTDGN